MQYDDKGRRLSIIQDIDTLYDKYLYRWNYDLMDALFPTYVRWRVGFKPDIKKQPWYDPLDDTEFAVHIMIEKCKIQDCWEIYIQKGYKQEFAMSLMLDQVGH